MESLTAVASSGGETGLRFFDVFWSHPFWLGKEDPWIRIVFLPSKYLRGKEGGASARPSEIVVRKAVLREKWRKIQTENEKGWDVYFMVNPCEKGLCGFAKNEDIIGRLWLPLDLDYKLPVGGESAASFFAQLGIAPSLVVSTSERDGFRHHQGLIGVQWEDGKWCAEDEKTARVVCRKLCAATGSDPVHDAKRILRLPGTINWKGAEKDERTASRAEIIFHSPESAQGTAVPRLYTLDELDGLADNIAGSAFGEGLRVLRMRDLREGGTTRPEGAGYFGTWREALDKAEQGQWSVGEGSRHNALISWAAQMAAGRVKRDLIAGNIRDLAAKAFKEPYLEQEDLDHIIRDAEKFWDKVDGELDAVFVATGTEEQQLHKDLEQAGAVRAPEVEFHASKQNEAEKVEANGHDKTAAPSDFIPKLDLEQYGERWAFCSDSETEEEWLGWLAEIVIAASVSRSSNTATFQHISKLIVQRLRKLGLGVGRNFSAPRWIEGVRGQWSLIELTEVEARGFLQLVIWGIQRAVVMRRKDLAKQEAIQRRKEKTFKIVFSVKRAYLSELVDAILVRGVGNMKDVDMECKVICQNGIFDIRSGKFLKDEAIRPEKEVRGVWSSAAAMRIPGACSGKYLGANEACGSAGETQNFEWFMGQAFPEDPGTVDIVLRIIGYCLMSGNPLQKLFSLEGTAGGGKGILAEIIMHLVGLGAAGVADFERVGTDAGLGSVCNKQVIFIDEAERADRKAHDNTMSVLKRAVGGFLIPVRQLYESAKEVRVKAKFILASNKPFQFEDSSRGFGRRAVSLHFAHRGNYGREGLAAQIVRLEGDYILTRAVRALHAAWNESGDVFESDSSLALLQGKENLEAATGALRLFLSNILERGDGECRVTSILLEKICIFALEMKKFQWPRGRLDQVITAEMEALGFNRVKHVSVGDSRDNRGFSGCSVSKEKVMNILGMSEPELTSLALQLPTEKERLILSEFIGVPLESSGFALPASVGDEFDFDSKLKS